MPQTHVIIRLDPRLILAYIKSLERMERRLPRWRTRAAALVVAVVLVHHDLQEINAIGAETAT